jgi:7-cyano-7-deazaguanine synthase
MAKTPQKRAVVLLSAGLDSTYNLLRARDEFSVLLVLTFNYGQRAAVREVGQAARIATLYGYRHQVVNLPWFSHFTKTALLSETPVPAGPSVEIDNLNRSFETAKNVWVPNRNGIFLNIAAGFAEGLAADFVIPGFNREEAQTFPDNSSEFLHSLDASWKYSTGGAVRTFCFSTELSKTEIVERAKVDLPFTLMWPCYLGGATWCGECESCLRFKRALSENDLSFPELQRAAAL